MVDFSPMTTGATPLTWHQALTQPKRQIKSFFMVDFSFLNNVALDKYTAPTVYISSDKYCIT